MFRPRFTPVRLGRAALLAGAMTLGLAACGGGGAARGTTGATAPAGPASTAATAGDNGTVGSSMPDMPGMASANAAPLSPTQGVATQAVKIDNFAFSPAVVTVKVGTTVTWTNNDEEPHTVVGGGLKSPVMGNQGATFSYTFSKAGTYNYNCSIHPFMHGMVVVTA